MKYAIPPITTHEYDKGKRYKIRDYDQFTEDNASFYLIGPKMHPMDIFCLEKGCSTINYMDWEIVDE